MAPPPEPLILSGRT
ncbi:hypothetical protein YPPY32_4774, partial [Yersinia pestis PY-32]